MKTLKTTVFISLLSQMNCLSGQLSVLSHSVKLISSVEYVGILQSLSSMIFKCYICLGLETIAMFSGLSISYKCYGKFIFHNFEKNIEFSLKWKGSCNM